MSNTSEVVTLTGVEKFDYYMKSPAGQKMENLRLENLLFGRCLKTARPRIVLVIL